MGTDVWKLGNRWRLFGRHHREYEQGGVVAVPAGPSDAEVIARVARHVLRFEATTGFDDRAEALRDIRAILIRSDAGRAVLGRPLDALGEDPVDVLTRERDSARDEAKWLISDYETRLDAARQRAVMARTERDEATRELRDVSGGFVELVEFLLTGAPESWDSDQAGHVIVRDYVRALEARLDALRVPREKYPEDGDGAAWPDPVTDPCGFADAAAAYQLMHSGCRCRAFGHGAPEHAPSFLCNPKPGDRRCTNAGCRREGEFGHEDLPVPADDPWSSGDGTAPVAAGAVIVSEPICGKPVMGGPGDPEMMCARPAGHDPMPWCGFDEIAARVRAPEWTTIGEGGAEGAYTVHHGRDGVTRTFEDAQHFDTECEDRPHCTIVEHHAVEDLENQGRPPAGPDLPELECAARTSHGGHEHSVMMAEAQPGGVPAVHAPFWCPGVPERRWPQDGASDVTYGGSSGPGCPDTQP